MQRVWRTGAPEHLPATHHQDEREQIWTKYYVYRLPGGEVVAIFDDVTERRQAKEALRRSEAQVRAVLNASPVGVALVDRAENVLLWNPAAEAIFGWKEQEVLGCLWPVVPLENQAEFEDLRQRVLAGEQPNGLTIRHMRRDGSPVDVAFSCAPTFDSSGTVTGSVAVMRDVTGEMRDREQLLLQANALDQVNDAVMGTDLDGRVICWNQAAERLSGFAAEEVLGRLPLEVMAARPLEAGDIEDLGGLLLKRGYWGG